MRTLLIAAGIHTLGPDAPVRGLVVDDHRIAWIGDPADAPEVDRTVDLAGGWVTPAFVDAHVHATETGLAADGVDLAGAASLAEALDRLRRHASTHDRPVILGSGWEETRWPEARPPTAAEVATAAPGRTVLLSRVDGHSCVVDPRTLARLPLDRLEGVDRDRVGAPTGWVREQSSQAARVLVLGALPERQLADARQVACRRAAELGIGSLHEMGHPGLVGLGDAIAWSQGSWPIEVLVWWAELDADAGPAHGLRPGGDLFLDGSIGSRTAAVTGGYADVSGDGMLFHPDEAVDAFFTDCTQAGRGAGVHAIGDRAIEQALAAIEHAAAALGDDAVRRCRHRIEHVELPRPDHLARMARLGVVASMQPAFDATWGGPEGLYARCFGVRAALASNPVGALHEAGVPLAFGSDSTVTPLDPWGAVHAAEHHLGGSRLARAAALRAHTLGGRHVAGQDTVGALLPGLRADLAVWDADPLTVDDVRSLACTSLLVAGHDAFSAADVP